MPPARRPVLEHQAWAYMIGAASAVVVLGANFLAQVSEGVNPSDTATWVTGGGVMASAGALAYIVRMVAQGRLVHRDPATAEEALRVMAERVAKLTEDAYQRESDYRTLLMEHRRVTEKLIQQNEND